MNGKTWLLLGLLGGIILLFVARQQRDGLIDAPAPAAQDDYYMRDFVLTVFDANGQREYVARGPDLRRTAAGDYTLEKPEIEWLEPDGPPWLLRAERGRLDGVLENARLDGVVTLDRAISPAVRLETSDVTSHLPSREAHTAAAALIRRGGSELRGLGLRADLRTARLTLLANVRGTYVP